MSKKPNRQGTVYYSESSKLWVAELRWKDKTGKSHRKVWKDRKKTVVYASLDAYKRQLSVDGTFDIENDVTFAEYATYWLDTVLKTSLKPSSYMRKEVVLRVQVLPFIGNCIISNLSQSMIQSMINSLSQTYSYSTVKKAYEAVNGCINHYNSAVSHSSENPCRNVVLPNSKARDIADIPYFDKTSTRLLEDEAGRIKENGAPKYRLGQAIIVLLYTGIRVSELLALRWSDVDFDNHFLSVTKNLVQIKNDGELTDNRYKLIIQDSTKTKSSNRIVPLNTKAESALRSLLTITGTDDYVITTVNHALCAPYNMSKLFHEIQTNAGIPQESQHGVHALRHTFASMLYRNGCDTKIVSELLGHSSVKITEDIYIHLAQEQKALAISNIDCYLD